MTFAFISLLATLAVILALNWGRFQEMGAAKVFRLLLIWGVILTAGVLVVKLLGF